MPDNAVLAESPAQILKDEHRKLRELFAECANLEVDDETGRERLFREIKLELTIHAELEELLFYPAVREVDSAKAGAVVDEAVEVLLSVKTLLEEMSELGIEDELFDATMRELRRNVEHHAEDEETLLFPLAGTLPKGVQERLRIEMKSLRNDLEDQNLE